jgi:hypothetical protein
MLPAMYVDLDEWLKVTSSWRMRSRSPSPHNILIRPASSSHIVPNRSITAGQKSEDTPLSGCQRPILLRLLQGAACCRNPT